MKRPWRTINRTILLTLSVAACGTTDVDGERDFRLEMRNFVQAISVYAKGIRPAFAVIPQNGHELLTTIGTASGALVASYVNAIDGVGREDLFYGYVNDNVATPAATRDAIIAFMDVAEGNGIDVLVTDYVSTRSSVDDSYARNAASGYISFAADRRELDNIPVYPPTPHDVNTADVVTLSDAKNFLYLLDPESFADKSAFLNAVRATNHDLLIIDLFFAGTVLTQNDVISLKTKANGSARLAIAYMSIGEAGNFRDYWQAEWGTGNPPWIEQENPDFPGNFKVKYWEPVWQSIIFGNDDSYLKKILDAGFDGVYLDIIDAFEFFEVRSRDGA